MSCNLSQPMNFRHEQHPYSNEEPLSQEQWPRVYSSTWVGPRIPPGQVTTRRPTMHHGSPCRINFRGRRQRESAMNQHPTATRCYVPRFCTLQYTSYSNRMRRCVRTLLAGISSKVGLKHTTLTLNNALPTELKPGCVQLAANSAFYPFRVGI